MFYDLCYINNVDTRGQHLSISCLYIDLIYILSQSAFFVIQYMFFYEVMHKIIQKKNVTS